MDADNTKNNRPKMKTTQIAIKLNNCASNDPCAICGQRTDPEIGAEFFLADSWALVCHPCAEKNAPELWALHHLKRTLAALTIALHPELAEETV
jgi:recombinational DNA repair protein (RecF pathway)